MARRSFKGSVDRLLGNSPRDGIIGDMIKAVLFDLGGVLFTDGTKQFVRFLHDERRIEVEKVDNLINNLINGDLGS
jgi:hypothetical protein